MASELKLDAASVSSDALAAYYNKNGVSLLAAGIADQAVRERLCELLGSPVGTSGGAESFISGGYVGGYDALQDYGNSMYSKAKERLIRDIAADVFSALKSSGVKNAKTAPIGDVVSSLAKMLPPKAHSARKFGPDFNKSSESQRKVCHALANSLNRHYGGSIIDMSANENEMCNKVAEVMYSLFTGLHTEFMSVAGDVMRVMNNMQTVMNYIKAAYEKQKELIQSSSDVRLRDQSSNTDSVYKSIVSEYERQMAVLANLINVTVGPTGKSLISSLEDNRDFSGLVKDIRSQVGTQAFGDKLSYLLSGISSVAHSAELIDKALKKIGMSVGEFKSAKNAGDLRMKVMSSIMKGSPGSKQLDDMMRAAQIIYNNNYDHDAISKAMSKSGRGEFSGGVDGGEDSDDEVQGGDDDPLPAYWAKKSLSKKIENKKTYRNLILKDFRKLLRTHFQSIVNTANEISSQIGTSIPISDDLDHFVQVFGNLQSLDEENLHVALSGYPKDSKSREKREMFVNSYEIVINVLESLSKGPQGAVFKSLQTALRSMIKAIDDFSDKMVTALTEIHVDTPDEIAADLRKTSSTFYGSGDGGDDSFGSGSWVAFDKVKMEMKYFYSIANIKTNIGRSADDMKTYANDYEQIIGEEAGWLINRIRAEFKCLIEHTNPVAADRVAVSAELRSLVPLAATRADTIYALLAAQHQADVLIGANANRVGAVATGLTFTQVAHKNLVSLWTRQMDAKVNMVKVAQAVDLYLKAFTDGISRNPDSVQSVVKMLDQVELVAKWFNDKSGDNLANLFDVFPSSAANAAKNYLDSKDAVVAVADGTILAPYNNHYYEYVESKWDVGLGGSNAAGPKQNLPGNPFIGRPLMHNSTTEKQFTGIMNMSERVIKSMRALENILSAFSSVGSKFGDLDPAAKTFMNPGQIFNALCGYISASSFASQFAPGDGGHRNANLTSAIYHGRVEAKSTFSDAANNEVSIPSHPATQGQFRQRGAGGRVWSQNLAQLQNNDIMEIDAAAYGATPVNPGATQNGIITGVSNVVGADQYLKYSSLALAAVPADETLNATFWKYHDPEKRNDRLDLAGWKDECFDTDMLFLMTIKSIVAKVFTVVDAYRLFHRPTTDYTSHYSLNPLRTILGGADGGVDGGAVHSKIIPEALELYMRLPLLAEWYRENYSFKTSPNTEPNRWRLSLVPSIDGVWSGFINVIFDKADYVKEGNYSETQVNVLVNEMNSIWKLYKSKYPKATVRQIINAFVIEMNRIFGFVKQREIDEYLKDRRSYLSDTSTDGKDNFLDYDILDANDQFGSRPAPSDKFTNIGLKTNTRPNRPIVQLLEEIERIRKNMDTAFNNAISDINTGVEPSFSFIDTLRTYRNEISNAKNENDEYQVVLRMIQGASKNVKLGSEKLIMIHEMVAAPLAVLYGVYKVLVRYNALLHGCSLKNLGVWTAHRVANAGTGAGAAASRAQVITLYNAVLREIYAKRAAITGGAGGVDVVHLTLMTKMLVGHIVGAANINAGGVANPDGYLLAGQAGNNPFTVNNFDGVHLCQDILSAILDLCANPNKLVTCSIGAAGHINVDYSALEELCISMLGQIKSNIQKLRQMFPPSHTSLVDKYEARGTVASTRWLEENLIEVLFKDRDECGLPRAHSDHLHETLKALFRQGVAANNLGAADARYGSMDRALQGLVYYEQRPGAADLSLANETCRNNFTRFPFNVIPLKKNVDTSAEKEAVALCILGSTNNIAASPAALALPVGNAMGNANQQAAATRRVNAIRDSIAERIAAVNDLTYVPVINFETDNTINTFGLNTTNSFKSMMTAFNKILHMYMYTNLEEGTNKFYLPLIESFANSAASLEVIQGRAYPNISILNHSDVRNAANLPSAGGALRAPPAETIVFASNAYALRGLLTSTVTLGTTQKKKHAFENFAEIPESLKERMKVNLPFFSKMLQNLADRAILLKNILNNTEIKNNIGFTAGGADVAIQAAVPDADAPALVAGRALDSTIYYNGMLGKLIDLCLSLKKCSDGVYKELQDKVPYFLETTKDFLVDYRQRVGGMPIMPASSLLIPLTCLEEVVADWKSTDGSHVMMPVKENGSATYRFNYATRLILARNDVEIQLEHMPGAKELYNSYASVSGKNATISPQEYASTISNMVKLTKFLADGAVYGRLYDRPARGYTQGATDYASRNVFTALKWSPDAQVVAAIGGGAAADAASNIGSIPSTEPDAAARGLWATHESKSWIATDAELEAVPENRKSKMFRIYPLTSNVSVKGIVELTENTNIRASKENLAQAIGERLGSQSRDARSKLQVQNILEYNIVPINVHAFMREVPFVNLLNYSYTFDRMVHEFVMPNYVKNLQAYGPNNNLTSDNLMIPANAACASTREIMVKLLTHPYADFGPGGVQYYSLVASLFNGNDNLKLGRPRYLSDQLWHKALLTSAAQLVAGQSQYDPAVSSYPSQMKSLEAGPAAYEAVRAVMRYGAPNRTEFQNAGNATVEQNAQITAHLANNGVMTRLLGNIAAAAASADAATIAGVAAILGNGAAGNMPLPAIAGATVAAADHLNYNITSVFIRALGVYPGAVVAGNLTPAQLAAAVAARARLVAIMQDPYNAYNKDNALIAGIVEASPLGLIRCLEAHTSGTDAYAAECPAPFNAVVVNNTQNNGNFHIISLYVDMLPGLSVDIRRLLKMIGALAISAPNAGGGNAIVAAATVAAIAARFAAGVSDPVSIAQFAAIPGNAGDTGIVKLPLVLRALLPITNLVSASPQFMLSGNPVSTRGLKIFRAGVGNEDGTWSVRGDRANAANTRSVGVFTPKPIAEQMVASDVIYCAELGKMRFDTKLVRNLTWLVQLQRIMRVVLTNHLSWLNTPVVRGLKIADSKMTEYNANEQFAESDFNGASYQAM